MRGAGPRRRSVAGGRCPCRDRKRRALRDSAMSDVPQSRPRSGASDPRRACACATTKAPAPRRIVQLLFAGVAVALGIVMPHVGSGSGSPAPRWRCSRGGRRTVAFIGIVFSLLFLTVQYSSTTFTPRLNLFRDAPIVWRAFALFTSVVVYSFTASLVIGRSSTRRASSRHRVRCCPSVARRVSKAADGGVQLHPARVDAGRGRGSGREVIDGLYTRPTGRQGRPTSAIWPMTPARQALHESAGRSRGHAAGHRRAAVLAAAERSGPRSGSLRGRGDALRGIVIAVAGGSPIRARRAVLHALTVGSERTSSRTRRCHCGCSQTSRCERCLPP